MTQFGLPRSRGTSPAYRRILAAERAWLARSGMTAEAVAAPKPVWRAPKVMERRPAEQAWTLIIEAVAVAHGLTAADILGDSRCRRFVLARQEAMYRLAGETKLTIATIGKHMRRDHTTVLHGVFAYADRHGLLLPRSGTRFKGKRGPNG